LRKLLRSWGCGSKSRTTAIFSRVQGARALTNRAEFVFLFILLIPVLCRRHSAKLSRLLTAGTKSLLTLIASESSAAKTAAPSTLDSNKQGDEWQDWKYQIINQMHGQQQQQQQQQQPNLGSFEGSFLLTASIAHIYVTFPLISAEDKPAVVGLRSPAAAGGGGAGPYVRALRSNQFLNSYACDRTACAKQCFCADAHAV